MSLSTLLSIINVDNLKYYAKEKKMKLKGLFIKLGFLLLFSTPVWFGGCSSSDEHQSDDTSTSVSFSVKLIQNSDSSPISNKALGTINDIVSVTVKVERVSDSLELVPETNFTEISPGVWEITLADLPVDTELRFIANAYNISSQVIFTDTVNKMLINGGNNDTVFKMISVDDGVEPSNPIIASVTIPDEIVVKSFGNTISFNINHPAVVDYDITVQNGVITSAASGTHDPSSDLEVIYTAPAVPGEDTITLKTKDPNLSDEVGMAITFNVVAAVSTSNNSVLFGPAVTGMNVLRTATTLELEVQTDPLSGLSYSWSGTGDFTSLVDTVNPVIIEPFNDTDTGAITATVTDGSGIQASLTRTIEPGDFPLTIIPSVIRLFPDTGQTVCYDVSGNTIACPLANASLAQDGSYSINPPSFTNNGDGTVTDNNTTLIWQREDDNTPRSWETAKISCTDSILAGYNDWRLPNVKELQSIVDYGVFNPSIDSLMFPNSEPAWHWTSSEVVNSTYAWRIFFGHGGLRDDPKNLDSYVRCVRGGNAADFWSMNFTDIGNGTIIHASTKLMWQKEGDHIERSWGDSLAYCESLNLAGHDNWRLPNIKELASITDVNQDNPSINGSFFPNTDINGYWSSSTFADTSNNEAWSIWYSKGRTAFINKTSAIFVRCVRSGT